MLTKCRAALAGIEGSPGPKAPRQAVVAASEGTVLIVADSKSWAACDTGYRSGSALEVSVRQPGSPVRPGLADVDAFAVAGNVVRVRGKEHDYYWAAGLVPAGVETIRYTFPGGTTEDAVVTGKYWLMHHWSPVTRSAGKVRVRLLAANGVVLADFRLEPGVHTCAQISHGC